MKKRFFILFILVNIILIFSCNQYYDLYIEAKNMLREKKLPDYHKAALDALDRIPVTSSFFQTRPDDIIQLKQEIREDYSLLQKEQIMHQYGHTIIAYIDNDTGSLLVQSLNGQMSRELIRGREFSKTIAQPRWSPDGNWIVFQAKKPGQPVSSYPGFCLYLVSADEAGVRQLTEFGKDEFPTWSPDGKKVLFNRLDKYTVSIDIKTGKETILFPLQDEFSGFHPQYVKNNRDIVFNRKGSLQLFKSDTKKIIDIVKEKINKNPNNPMGILSGLFFQDPILSHYNNMLAVSHNGVLIINMDTFETTEKKIGGLGAFVSWSPDDAYLLVNDFKEKTGKGERAFFITSVKKDPVLADLYLLFIGYGRFAQWGPLSIQF